MGKIRLNQIGYKREATKQFIYVGEEKSFRIIQKEINVERVVFEGKLSMCKEDKASGEKVSTGLFSTVTEEGTYLVEVNDERSLPFKIHDGDTQKVLNALTKAFYYQRCGFALEECYAAPWQHGPCHVQKSYLYDEGAERQMGQELDASGGWHDAGDYGRYTVAAAKAVADLLLAYIYFPKAFEQKLNIPESALPGVDLLHEVKVELDWMLKMQRMEDGAVYTKVATRYFPNMIMPEKDLEPLMIFDVSSPATGDFAAVMALAAEVYEKFDSVYAKILKDAAIKAYQWLEANPEPKFFTNPENILYGEYGDSQDIDERYWAAAQLYHLTGEEKYHRDFINYHDQLEDKLSLGWADVGGYGTWTYLRTQRATEPYLSDSLKNRWLNFAELLESRSQKDGYGVTLSIDEYIWGSNMVLLNQSIHLIIANYLLDSKRFDELILRNWNYLFGMNAMDISYVTGFGTQRVMAPHHRPSEADSVLEPVPGLISGGPCSGLYDEAIKEHCQGQPPAKCFLDQVHSYSTNEITIYWNSPGVFVAAYQVIG